jgi:triosephosphate isomerase
MDTWVVGNWKMNGSREQIAAYVPALLAGLPAAVATGATRVGLCPPTPYLATLGAALAGSPVALGAQNVHALDSGAFTGEVSPAMLREMGAVLCLVGHSERRRYFSESDAAIAQKLHGLLSAGLGPILCVGETLTEREAGRQEDVIRSQLVQAFAASNLGRSGRRVGDVVQRQHPELSREQATRLILAYEPVWAIGTGVTATPEQAGEMHAYIRALLTERFGAPTAGSIPILYGGSVTAGNAGALMAQREINGSLVGGASLKPEAFLPIIEQSQN